MENSKSILLAPSLIKSPDKEFENFRNGDCELFSLSPLAQTNIFVGATNSGKTRFMRLLLRQSKTVIVAHSCRIEDLIATTQECLRTLEEIKTYLKGRDALHVHSNQLRLSFSNSNINIDMIERSVLNRIEAEIISQIKFQGSHRKIHADFIFSYFQALSETVQNYLHGVHSEETFQNAYYPKLFEMLFASRLNALSTEETSVNRLFANLISSDDVRHLKKTADMLLKLSEILQGVRICVRNVEEKKNVYIPTLRSAHTLSDSNGERTPDTFFRTNIADHYQLAESVEIFTGLELYQQLDRDVRGRRRKDLELFEEFLSKTFFNSIGVEIIPEHPAETVQREPQKGQKRHGVIAVKLGRSGVEMPIHLLGDGIQSIIILLYRVFMASSDTWFFIDEPEIGLHPGLQRIFLDAITNHPDIKKKNHRFFLTTHSNHLLDLTIDKKNISIFTFSSTGEGDDQKHIIRSSSNDGILAMTELGVLNSSVLMANCSIWVEGVTDRLYIQKYLNEYCDKNQLRKYQEDIHYAFFEYAGSNLAHYAWATDDDCDADTTGIDVDSTEKEVTDNDDAVEKISMQFIANRVFLIADRDEGKTEKHNFWSEKAKNSNGAFNYYVTPGKEVENLSLIHI